MSGGVGRIAHPLLPIRQKVLKADFAPWTICPFGTTLRREMTSILLTPGFWTPPFIILLPFGVIKSGLLELSGRIHSLVFFVVRVRVGSYKGFCFLVDESGGLDQRVQN